MVSLRAPGTLQSTSFPVSSCGREGTANARVGSVCFAAAATLLSVLRTKWKKSERKGSTTAGASVSYPGGSEDPSSGSSAQSLPTSSPALTSRLRCPKSREAAGETVRWWWWGWHLTSRDFPSPVCRHGETASVAEFVYFCAPRCLIFIWIDPSKELIHLSVF